ncbi:DMT family transporter [Shimia biformata]|uniref:DMT family transporter n=1 Tax=Shimia biformata TaxID=1294299 RepID=UPI00194F6446|nr:DMT family transporter [Shimia biformata]
MTASTAKGNSQGALFALLAFGIFSAHDVFIKTLGGSYAPMQILFFSGLLSFPLMTLMLIGDSTKDHVRPAHPWWLALRCLAMLVSATAGFYAVANLPLAQFYAIIFATPLLITVLSIPILGETVRLRRWAAVIVGLCGVMIVLRPGSAELGAGHLAALFCAMGGATNSVVVRKIGRDERAVVLMLYPMLVSFLVLGATLPFVYKPMPIQHLGLMALIAAFSFVAMLCLIRAYRFGEAVIVAPMQYSQILWAILYGALFFGETLDPATIVGASVVIASGLYILFRESQGSSSANKPVLRSRSREATGSSLRVSSMLRRGGYETMDD